MSHRLSVDSPFPRSSIVIVIALILSLRLFIYFIHFTILFNNYENVLSPSSMLLSFPREFFEISKHR